MTMQNHILKNKQEKIFGSKSESFINSCPTLFRWIISAGNSTIIKTLKKDISYDGNHYSTGTFW